MCGIIGYTGQKNALPILTEGLLSLEYRGYDSAGIAYFKNGQLEAVKSQGRIDILKSKLDPALSVFTGIGHTRWATHGAPSDINSHPHGTDKLYIVHNGIIENYAELKEILIKEGYSFISETDTEVAAKLIDLYFEKSGNPSDALRLAAQHFRGSYAIAAIFKDFDGKLFGIRHSSPLIAALSDRGGFIASDISALLSYTDRYYTIGEDESVEISADSLRITDKDGNAVERKEEKALFTKASAEKGGFDHFMLKEIHEEPDAIMRTLSPHIRGSLPFFKSPILSKESIKAYSHIHIVACGTAYHAGLIGRFAIEKLARKRVSVELASEFRYNSPILSDKDLVIVISQSGETADTLAALRLAKEKGAAVLGIVNVVGSSVARESNDVIFTLCGPEIAVASTKAYSVQISLLYLLSIHLAYSLGNIDEDNVIRLVDELITDMPKRVSTLLDKKKDILKIAEGIKDSRSIFFIGRGIDFCLSAEAALKCKEISYIHCEAYAAGELKHGTISLVEEGTPVVAVMTDPDISPKTISNIREVKSRGANLLLITSEGIDYPSDIADSIILLPKTTPLLSPVVSATTIQLLAYYLSFSLGLDVDKPRNLAKSVTVE